MNEWAKNVCCENAPLSLTFHLTQYSVESSIGLLFPVLQNKYINIAKHKKTNLFAITSVSATTYKLTYECSYNIFAKLSGFIFIVWELKTNYCINTLKSKTNCTVYATYS